MEMQRFNVEGLIGELNERLYDPQETIMIGEFRPGIEHDGPIRELIDEDPLAGGLFNLTYDRYGMNPVGTSEEVRLGRIYVENGVISSGSGRQKSPYEKIKVWFNYDIEMKDIWGKPAILPRCSVRLKGLRCETGIKRKDIRRFGKGKFTFGIKKADFSDILPNLLFMRR